MKKIKISLFSLIIASVLASCGSAAIVATPITNVDHIPTKNVPLTDEQIKVWSAMDLTRDTVPGMSVDRAYEEIIKNRKGKTVIVGVIDSGLDIDHEDLKNVLWVNEGEIAGNNIDDDNNGYVDDIHGWNFLGDILGDQMESTRIVRRFRDKFEDKDVSEIAPSDMEDFELYQKARKDFDEKVAETANNKTRYSFMIAQIEPAHQAMVQRFGKEDYTIDDLNSIEDPTQEDAQRIAMLTQMLSFGDSIDQVLEDLQNGVEYFDNRLKYHFNLEEDFREVLGDDPFDINDKYYGDNNVVSIDPTRENALHGTHVAGIIAAERNNGIGTDGVANNVRIMAVRAVPDGDEHDKDIALAIRYAVDNGAKILNTSFGKYFSPNSEWVYDAIKYAASKDVLIVNAAGNDAYDLDTINVYPNDQWDNGSEIADSFITVGALNYEYGENMLARFTNYGKINVDVFAPGVQIYAPTPNNEYKLLNGTSMAAPNVAGVAAMIRSLYPKLTAPQVKKIILESGISPNIEVILGGNPQNRDNFRNISTSGKIVNMYNALIMADKISRQ
ncbi:MAG: S8 family serine peptidase [Bacteroidetes bacterium]|nr:S8 family serine peptidase [Bacteroidota bacterium]